VGSVGTPSKTGVEKVGNKEERVRRRRARGGRIVAPGNCGLPLIGVAVVAALGSARDRLVLKSIPTWVKKPNFLFSQVTGASRIMEVMTFVV